MNHNISITAIASTSALGASSDEIWDNYLSPAHCLNTVALEDQNVWAGIIPAEIKAELEKLRSSNPKYLQLDNSVILAIYTARKAMELSGWSNKDHVGINIGSSRGATELFEKYHEQFVRNGKSATLTSPTTTLGNISSWVGHDLKTSGPDISHSITCSTSLHALLNACAWLESGMASKFIVGGSESSLTPFTIAQMQALKIYAENPNQSQRVFEGSYPCRALDLNKNRNTMVLGEAAAIACLELGVSENTMAVIEGVGYATEVLEHNVSLSTNADCLQNSMQMALGNISPEEIDVVVLHAPGTVKGDRAEYLAIQKLFGHNMPALTTNKWKIGHCLGASGMLSIELAVQMLSKDRFIEVPYINSGNRPEKINKVLVNAVGFGGNAVSILLKKP